MNKKQLYETPETELLVVRFEGNIMSPTPGKAGDDETYNEYTEDF